MKSKKNIIIEQYNALSTFLQKLTDKEIVDLENGEKEIKFQIINKGKHTTKEFSIDEDSIQEIISKLNCMTSREEGNELLNSKCSVRQDYESIAKRIDIPYTQKDTIEKLKEKIIEGTIGFRLRSQAIQDKNE
ncbi:hypothetical protein EZS27_020707 [termite gut metagenome]|uniref:Uncharacterized protein n=1 Tax=termite gut metagenome TaxID=433724 RepID=A0A5J4RA28_9ZZZZ